MSKIQKTPVQIHLDALNRKRKPLIDLNKKPLDESIKERDATIENLSRQLAKLQEANTAKETYIKELEDKLAVAITPKPSPEVVKTEEIPNTRQRRARIEEPKKPEAKPEEIKKPESEPRPAPSTASPQGPPSDGITEED